jgi:hypothetical protein
MNIITMKEIVGILMESSIYFELTLQERHGLVRHILEISSSQV